MLPDLYWNTIPLGPLTVQVWGLFVALGVVFALVLAKKVAKTKQLDEKVIIDLAFWVLLFALIGGRLFFVVTELELFTNNWLSVLYIWEGGMSISGGFIGALIAGYVYLKLKKQSFWKYAEVIFFSLPLGLFIGRLGCFFIYDHPGSITDFFLGEVYYYDGLVHHNHGLYLALNGLVMMLVFWFLRKKYQAKTPYFSIIFLLWYGTIRLALDFDRILDSRTWGLTGAQWFGIVCIVLGLAIFGQRQNIRKRLKNL